MYLSRDTNPNFTSRVTQEFTTSNTSYTVTLSGGYYYRWQVAALNGSLESPNGSPTRYLYLSLPATKPPAPTGLQPGETSAPGTSVAAGTVNLSWNEAQGATSYRLYVTRATNQGFTNPDAYIVRQPVSGRSYALAVQAGYYYRWTVAGYNEAGEGDAIPNRFFYVPAGTVDLIPFGLAPTPSSAAPGATVTVNFSVKNEGTSSSRATTYNLRLSPASASVATPSHPALAEGVTLGAIAAGGTQTFSRSVTVPSGTLAGSYKVWVIVDIAQEAGQTAAESNDQLAAAFTVPAPAGVPDLIPEVGTPTPASGTAGASVAVAFAIKNQGSGASAASAVRLRLSPASALEPTTSHPQLGADIPVAALAVGERRSFAPNVVIPAGTAAGSYKIWVIVDINRSAGQTVAAENNDRVPAVFTVTGGSSGLSAPVVVAPRGLQSAPTLLSGSAVDLQWQGVADAEGYRVFVAQSTSSSGTYTRVWADGLDVGSAARSFRLPLSPGTYYRWTVVGLKGGQEGPYEPNHYFYTAGTAQRPSITSVNPSAPFSTGQPQPFTLNGTGFTGSTTVRLKNVGLNDPAAEWTVSTRTPSSLVINPNFGTSASQWEVEVFNGTTGSGVYPFSTRNPEGGAIEAPVLSGGASMTRPGPVLTSLRPRLSWNAVQGADDYVVNMVDESRGLTVVESAVVTTSSFDVPTGALRAGNAYLWSVFARRGTARGPSSTGYFSVSGANAQLGYPTPLSPGSTLAGNTIVVAPSAVLTWEAASGADSYMVLLTENARTSTSITSPAPTVQVSSLKVGSSYAWTVEAVFASGERRRSTKTLYFDVQAAPSQTPPDYTVESVVPSVASARPGSPLTVEFRIRNSGGATTQQTRASIRINQNSSRAYDSDLPGTLQIVNPVAPGAVSDPYRVTINVPERLANGPHYIWVTVDVDRSGTYNLAQSNEDNDRRAAPLTITGSTVVQADVAALRFPMCNVTSLDPAATSQWTLTTIPGEVVERSDKTIVPPTCFHVGEDWNHPRDHESGVKICAIANGVVRFSGHTVNYGNMVVIRHFLDGVEFESLYAHLREPVRQVSGATVEVGDYLGDVGGTPRKRDGSFRFSPHLHFEIRTPSAYTYGRTNGDQGFGGLNYAEPSAANGFPVPSTFIRSHSRTLVQAAATDLAIVNARASQSSVPQSEPVSLLFDVTNAGRPIASGTRVQVDLVTQGPVLGVLHSYPEIVLPQGATSWTYPQTVPSNRYTLPAGVTGNVNFRVRVAGTGAEDNLANNEALVPVRVTGEAPALGSCDLKTQQCYDAIAAEMHDLYRDYRIPMPILAVLIYRESRWRQYDRTGGPLMNGDPDGDGVGGESGDGGFGIGQITPRCATSSGNCGHSDVPGAFEVSQYVPSSNPFGYVFSNRSVDLGTASSVIRRQFVDNWRANLRLAAGHLLQKFRTWATVTSATVPAPVPGRYGSRHDVDPSILENWYYALAWYNGCGEPRNGVDPYVNTNHVLGLMGNPTGPLSVHSMPVPLDGMPTTLSNFPKVVQCELKGLPWQTASASELAAQGAYTIYSLAELGRPIHRWDAQARQFRVITSEIRSEMQAIVSARSVQLEPGTNLISLPVVPGTTSTVSDLLGGVGLSLRESGASGLDPEGCYVASGAHLSCGPLATLPAYPNTGYIVYLNGDSPQEQEVRGASPSDTLELNRGLNFVGRPGDSLFAPNPDVYPLAFTLDGERLVAAPLDRAAMLPGVGYYLYAKNATRLVPLSGQQTANAGWTQTPEDQARQVRAVQEATRQLGDASSRTVAAQGYDAVSDSAAVILLDVSQEGADAATRAQVGWYPGATIGFDEAIEGLQALPLPRRPLIYVDESYGLSRSAHPPHQSEYHWPLVVQEGSGIGQTPLTLRWTIHRIPSEATVALIGLGGEVVADMKSTSSLTVLGAGDGTVWRYRIRVNISTPVAGTESEVLGAFELSAPRPNPSRALVSLDFTLPSSARATCEIFDLLGRVVARPCHGDYGQGRHTVRVEAPLAAGAYFFVMRVDGEGFRERRVRPFTVVR